MICGDNNKSKSKCCDKDIAQFIFLFVILLIIIKHIKHVHAMKRKLQKFQKTNKFKF